MNIITQLPKFFLTSEDIEHDDRQQNVENTMERLLSLGAIPIINENDTISTSESVVGDNDTLSAIVASTVHADLLVLLSDIDGLFTADPRKDPSATLIPTVCEITPEIKAMTSGAGTNLGTGGMTTKIQAAQMQQKMALIWLLQTELTLLSYMTSQMENKLEHVFLRRKKCFKRKD